MSGTEKLRQLNKMTEQIGRKINVSESIRKESRVKAVYGNLAIERPDLDIEHVRRVLGENRPK